MCRRGWFRSTNSLVTELSFSSNTHISTRAHMYTYMFTSVDILKRQYVFSFCVHLHMNTHVWCLWVVCAHVYVCAQRRDEELECSALPQSTWFLWDSFFFSPDLEPVWWSASPSDLPAYLCPPQCSGYQDVQPDPALSMAAEDLSLYPYAYRADILTFGTLYPNLVLLAYF